MKVQQLNEHTIPCQLEEFWLFYMKDVFVGFVSARLTGLRYRQGSCHVFLCTNVQTTHTNKLLKQT